MAPTVRSAALWIDPTCPVMRSVASAVWPASALTSEATTAKPRPAAPARAASIVALSASRLVCSATSRISVTTVPISAAARDRLYHGFLQAAGVG